jgi:hypothetical protein
LESLQKALMLMQKTLMHFQEAARRTTNDASSRRCQDWVERWEIL